MVRIVQIAPVGFEYDRIIEGVTEHPCNIIYLLKSYKEIKDDTDPDKRMIEIAEKFVNDLEHHFKESKFCHPIVKKTILIELEPIIEELCKIIQDEIEEKNAEKIWINISTSTKLFVSAAMYVGSFKPEFVRLFYIDASNYTTVNELFNPKKTRKQIKEKFEQCGITYKKSEESYRNIDVPLYPTAILAEQKKDVLKALKRLIKANGKKMVRFIDLLKELGKDPYDKTIKMRYGHHIKALKARNLVTEKVHGREKKYSLTQEGRILALILSYFIN